MVSFSLLLNAQDLSWSNKNRFLPKFFHGRRSDITELVHIRQLACPSACLCAGRLCAGMQMSRMLSHDTDGRDGNKIHFSFFTP